MGRGKWKNQVMRVRPRLGFFHLENFSICLGKFGKSPNVTQAHDPGNFHFKVLKCITLRCKSVVFYISKVYRFNVLKCCGFPENTSR